MKRSALCEGDVKYSSGRRVSIAGEVYISLQYLIPSIRNGSIQQTVIASLQNDDIVVYEPSHM